MRKIGRFGAILLSAVLLSGCGASSKNAADMEMITMGYDGSAVYTDAVYDVSEDMATMTAVGASSGTARAESAQTENDLAHRKLIREASLSVETKAYDEFVTALTTQLDMHGAYLQSGETSGNAERGNRWSYYVIRVPADRYEAFLAAVSSLGTVISSSEHVQDVTMDYTDMEAKLRALTIEEETLLTILASCEKIEDVLTVQARISEIQYEKDSYQSRLNRYDDLIAYCTVELSVDEVERVTIPVTEKTVLERIREDLSDNCAQIAEDARDFAVWFVSSLPYFGLWIVGIGIVVVVLIPVKKRIQRKRQEKRQDKVE